MYIYQRKFIIFGMIGVHIIELIIHSKLLETTSKKDDRLLIKLRILGWNLAQDFLKVWPEPGPTYNTVTVYSIFYNIR